MRSHPKSKKQKTDCLLFLLGIMSITILAGLVTACSNQPERVEQGAEPASGYVFEVVQEQTRQQEDARVPLTPYGLWERNQYMDYTVTIDTGLGVYVSSGALSRVELGQALEDGVITPEAIVSQAEGDARQGVCEQEIVCSHNNLTTFVYRYPAYSIGVLNDMFENDRGEKYLFREITFSTADARHGRQSASVLDDETYTRVDYPDWGVTLEAGNVTPEGMELRCGQFGKSLDGQLYLSTIFSIARKTEDGWEYVEPEAYEIPTFQEALEAGRTIPEGAQAVHKVDWTDMVGALEPGTYNLRFYVYKFDPVAETYGGQKVKVPIDVPGEG